MFIHLHTNKISIQTNQALTRSGFRLFKHSKDQHLDHSSTDKISFLTIRTFTRSSFRPYSHKISIQTIQSQDQYPCTNQIGAQAIQALVNQCWDYNNSYKYIVKKISIQIIHTLTRSAFRPFMHPPHQYSDYLYRHKISMQTILSHKISIQTIHSHKNQDSIQTIHIVTRR